MKQFTVITKDGSKWLRPSLGTATHLISPDLPYIGTRPEGTVLDESEVTLIYQMGFDSGAWTEVTYDEYIDKGERFPVRIAYTDAESHDNHVSKFMPLVKLCADEMREVEYWKKRAEAAERYISESPCDPDITSEQLSAYNAWQKLVKQK